MDNNMKDLTEVVQKVKGVEDGVTNLIIPILKDTIADSNKHNKRLFISNIVLTLMLLVVTISAMIMITYQNNKQAEFLSQFEFESEVYQDFDTSDNSVIHNPIINNQEVILWQ